MTSGELGSNVDATTKLTGAALALVDPKTGQVRPGTVVAFFLVLVAFIIVSCTALISIVVVKDPTVFTDWIKGKATALSVELQKSLEATKKTNLELETTNKKLSEQQRYLEQMIHNSWEPVSASTWQWEFPKYLEPGRYVIRAHGKWTVAFDKDKALALQVTCGPEGHEEHNADATNNMPMPRADDGTVDAAPGALICKKTEDNKTEIFSVGKEREIEVVKPAKLYFLCNDGDWPLHPQNPAGQNQKNGYKENTGYMWVQVIRKSD